MTGAPIHAIAAQLAGTFYSVEGIVDFAPAADVIYVVKGILSKAQSEIWVEEIETGKIVTEKIVQREKL